MDLDIGALFQTHILPHWPFVVVAFLLGLVGNTMTNRVWTREHAKTSKFFYWMRALLPLHAPAAGFFLALFGTLILSHFNSSMPVSPGVEGLGAILLYYTGAGAFSAWLFNTFRHFVESRGIDVPDALEGDPESSLKLPSTEANTPTEPPKAA